MCGWTHLCVFCVSVCQVLCLLAKIGEACQNFITLTCLFPNIYVLSGWYFKKMNRLRIIHVNFISGAVGIRLLNTTFRAWFISKVLVLEFLLLHSADPSGSSVCHPISIILFSHTNPVHVLLEPSLLSSSYPPAWFLHLQHPLLHLFPKLPLHMSKPPQPCLSNFVSNPPNLRCPTHIRISCPSCWSLPLNTSTSSSASYPFDTDTIFISLFVTKRHHLK